MTYLLMRIDFGHPAGALLGIISAAYNLGAICALPFVPWLNDTFGRRWAIFSGSWIMVVGALIQAFSINGRHTIPDGRRILLIFCSRNVRYSAIHPRFRHPLLHHRRFLPHGRTCLPQRTPRHDFPLQRPILRRRTHSSRNIFWHPVHAQRLVMADTFFATSWALHATNMLYLVSFGADRFF